MTQLTVVERAAVALGSSALEIHLSDLAKQHADIIQVSNKAGRDQVHGAAMALRHERTCIAVAGKQARDDANAFSKAVIAEEKRLIAIVEPEEKRLIALRDAWDEEQARIKREAAEAEAKRKAWHESQIDSIYGLLLIAAGAAPKKLRELISELDLIEPSEEIHAEYAPVVARAKAETLSKILEMLAEAEDREAEQARIKAAQEAEAARIAAEREELARLRAEAEARRQEDERKAAEARAAEEARLAAERAELARQREAQEAQARAEREEIERQAAELRAQQEAIRKQQEANEAEARRIERERAEADRKAAEEKARAEREEAARAESKRLAEERERQRAARENSPPSAEDVVSLVAGAYDISEQAALRWLSGMFGLKQAA